MINGNDKSLTSDVVGVMQQTQDPRLREIMVSLVKHLHSFARDVRLTEAEFREATALLNEIGKLASDTHNETVLMAGVVVCTEISSGGTFARKNRATARPIEEMTNSAR